MSGEVKDLSSLEISPKYRARESDLWTDEVRLPTDFNVRVFSPDLDSVFVTTDLGFAAKIEPPPPTAFFRPSLRDHSLLYVCEKCLGKLSLVGPRPTCGSCARVFNVAAEWSSLWIPPPARALMMEYAAKRVQKNLLNARDAEALASALQNYDFIEDLICWIGDDDPLKAHITAWDLEEYFTQVWRGWKEARKVRIPEKRLSRFRLLEEKLSTWSWEEDPHSSLKTGQAVPAKTKSEA